ncbi:unnamed protein product [Notodromas monacha]|uniref:Nucleolar protein 16 n=1 Tax=Notodromas monacha TaxID=399045 RepID=A0A7R9BN69_9CRUS|nr:unnamed protein product [Notodromas monacha]CAG0917093.1 unnamed protein product [Notodromas monacha]
MGKAAGVKRRRKKTRNPKKNYGKQQFKRRKMKTAKPVFSEPEMKDAWDPKKSAIRNITQMGLGLDPNKVIDIDILTGKESMIKSMHPELARPKMKSKKGSSTHVAEAMEARSLIRGTIHVKLSKPEYTWITKMLDKHGEDCEAIARDSKNLMQLTPDRIKHKIKRFKSAVDQYAEYLRGRGSLDVEME